MEKIKRAPEPRLRWFGWVWNLHLSSHPPFVHVADWSTHPQHLVTEPGLCLPESFATFLHIFTSLVLVYWELKGSTLEIQVYSQLRIELSMYGGMGYVYLPVYAYSTYMEAGCPRQLFLFLSTLILGLGEEGSSQWTWLGYTGWLKPLTNLPVPYSLALELWTCVSTHSLYEGARY